MQEFWKNLEDLGHFYTVNKNVEELLFHFNQQLQKLVATGFIKFQQPLTGKEKNILTGDIEKVKNIEIGDKGNASNGAYSRKNIIEGNITDADSFRLGDVS